jgi:hypothetical protein
LRNSRWHIFVIVVLQLVSAISNSAYAFTFHHKLGRKTQDNPYFYALALCDLKSKGASPDAIQIADLLNLTTQLGQLEEARRKAQSYNGGKLPAELREQLRDLKQDISDAIEQAHLEVNFVQAELAVEIAGQSEMVRAYSEARDNRVNSINNWSFRTNGVLWAVAEGLSIPTYRTPRYSIPSGTTGIIAGIVPSVFSLAAVRESGGGKYDRSPRQNMLAPLFTYPVKEARLDYPDSVLRYLHSVPKEDTSGKSRIDQLIERWVEDKNIHSLTDRNSRSELDILTGSVQHHLTIELVSDRFTMLQQLNALVAQMNRPLLELIMIVRGTKHFPVNNSPVSY